MDSAGRQQRLDDAFDAIEGAILPSLSVLLDNLLDAAAMALPGVDAERHAAELRRLGLEVAGLTRAVEEIVPLAFSPHEAARPRMSA